MQLKLHMWLHLSGRTAMIYGISESAPRRYCIMANFWCNSQANMAFMRLIYVDVMYAWYGGVQQECRVDLRGTKPRDGWLQFLIKYDLWGCPIESYFILFVGGLVVLCSIWSLLRHKCLGVDPSCVKQGADLIAWYGWVWVLFSKNVNMRFEAATTRRICIYIYIVVKDEQRNRNRRKRISCIVHVRSCFYRSHTQ